MLLPGCSQGLGHIGVNRARVKRGNGVFRAWVFQQTTFLGVYLYNKIITQWPGDCAFVNAGGIFFTPDSPLWFLTPIDPLNFQSRFLQAYFCSFVRLIINAVNIVASLRCLDCHGTFYKYEAECNTGAICLCNKPWTDSGFKIKTNVSNV